MMQAFDQKECDEIGTLKKQDCSLRLQMLHSTDKREATVSESPDILVSGLAHISALPDILVPGLAHISASPDIQVPGLARHWTVTQIPKMIAQDMMSHNY
jgi:hypothetical protein